MLAHWGFLRNAFYKWTFTYLLTYRYNSIVCFDYAYVSGTLIATAIESKSRYPTALCTSHSVIIPAAVNELPISFAPTTNAELKQQLHTQLRRSLTAVRVDSNHCFTARSSHGCYRSPPARSC